MEPDKDLLSLFFERICNGILGCAVIHIIVLFL
jgi:hypothetical protein